MTAGVKRLKVLTALLISQFQSTELPFSGSGQFLVYSRNYSTGLLSLFIKYFVRQPMKKKKDISTNLSKQISASGLHSRSTLPSDVTDLEVLLASTLLADNSFIVRCHVTSK